MTANRVGMMLNSILLASSGWLLTAESGVFLLFATTTLIHTSLFVFENRWWKG